MLRRVSALGLFAMYCTVTPAASQVPTSPADRPPSVDVTRAEIDAALEGAPPGVSDLPIRVVDVGSSNLGVYVVTRPMGSPNNAILHETEVTEVYYILTGAGTLVTGGSLVGPIRREAPGTTVLSSVNNVRGTSISGGTSRHLAAGDVVIIPGGVNHWWSSLDSDMTYLLIRPDPEKVLPLK